MRSAAKAVAAVGVPLLWHNLVLPGRGWGLRGRSTANVAFATGYALAFDGAPQWVSARGLRLGLASAGVVTAGYGVALAVPALRERMLEAADRAPEVTPIEWVAVHIPFGTVYTEELVFRGTLEPLLDKVFGARPGAFLGALTFGLWHIHPARAAGDSVPGTVVLTTLGGLIFGGLRRHSGSATAPALLHWALNAGGVLAPRLARRPGAVISPAWQDEQP